MNILDRLQRRMGRHYISGLMKYLCIAMLGVFILDYLPGLKSATSLLYFNRSLILKGQIWRLVSFIFLPPSGSLIFILINLYFYYFLGTSLENHWGSARFNIFYGLGILGNIVSGFISGFATNGYLNLSLLLAFAALYPDMEFLLFFILPVKVKWIGLFDAAYLIVLFFRGNLAMKVSLIFSLLPFFLFFGKSALQQLRMDARRLRLWLSRRR